MLRAQSANSAAFAIPFATSTRRVILTGMIHFSNAALDSARVAVLDRVICVVR